MGMIIQNGICYSSGGGGGGDEYSTDEVEIGTWIDGSKIYRKVINIGDPQLGGTDYKSFNHNITHLNRIIRATATGDNSAYFYAASASMYSSESNYVWLSWITSTQFQLRTKNTASVKNVCVILEYTKTED